MLPGSYKRPSSFNCFLLCLCCNYPSFVIDSSSCNLLCLADNEAMTLHSDN